ncbi:MULTISPECIES: alpha-L-fucosidase [Bacteroides]
MKNILLLLLTLTLSAPNLLAQTKEQNQKMKWWREARFGMFIHWGPYSILGGVYNDYLQRVGGTEWIMNRCKIPVKEYRDITRTFNPVKYNAEAWVKMAKDAGMKYIVITAKHHDGFAMFKSEASNYNIVDFTPYKKDVLDALAKACRKHGMKLGFYYSQIQDWNNPGGTTGRRPMSQGWPNPKAEEIDAYTLAHRGSWDPLQQTATREEYFERVAIPQIKELLTNYGDIAVFFWDTPSEMTEEYAEKISALFKDYPHIITNDRLIRDSEKYTGDYKTPEQTIPTVKQLDGTDWETCMTLNDSWGYKKRGNVWKTSRTLILSLIDIASKGGNFLLNIAPDGEGAIPEINYRRLKDVGDWMKKYSESIYGTERVKVKEPQWGRCTQKFVGGKTYVYLHVIDWPEDGKLLFRVYENASSATLLHNGEALKFKNTHDGIYLDLPQEAPDAYVSVIKLVYDKQLPKVKIKPMNTKNYEIVDENRKK